MGRSDWRFGSHLVVIATRDVGAGFAQLLGHGQVATRARLHQLLREVVVVHLHSEDRVNAQSSSGESKNSGGLP